MNTKLRMQREEDRYKVMLGAIEAERRHEEQYFKNLLSQKTEKEKIQSGVVWSSLELRKKHYTVGELVELEFERRSNLDQPHLFKTGVGCHLLVGIDETKYYRGTVSFVRKNKMGVLFNMEFLSKSDIEHSHKLSLELVYDERPYRVMKATIEELIRSKDAVISDFRESIRREALTQEKIKLSPNLYIDTQLNASQKEALLGSMAHQRFSIIHGPPGTGKTTTLVSLVKAITQIEQRVLICAPSNNAVDLLAKKLDQSGIRTLRLGNVSRIDDSIAHLSLMEKASNHPDWQHIKKVKIEAQEAKRQAGKFKRKFGAKERSDRNRMYTESRELKKWAKDLEEKLQSEIIHDAQAICCTLIGANSKALNDINFNTLLIDEASQALEPECWNAMLKSKRVILAGDHFQLPPTVKSTKAIKLGLAETLLNRMTDKIESTYLLREQYRMNDKLLGFSNLKFYKNKLYSNSAVANHQLQNDKDILTFIDTSGCGFEEEYNPENHSRKNPGEYFIIREHILQHLKMYNDQTIGIICPYAEQSRHIRLEIEEEKHIENLDIKVNSIDGFQGQERDIIYLSLVRSNAIGEVGFLKDGRRLNVALTRARKKLIIVGDVSTLSHELIFNELADFVEKTGRYQSAWEYMSL